MFFSGLLVDVLQARWGLNAGWNTEAHAMGLPRLVVGVLACADPEGKGHTGSTEKI